MISLIFLIFSDWTRFFWFFLIFLIFSDWIWFFLPRSLRHFTSLLTTISFSDFFWLNRFFLIFSDWNRFFRFFWFFWLAQNPVPNPFWPKSVNVSLGQRFYRFFRFTIDFTDFPEKPIFSDLFRFFLIFCLSQAVLIFSDFSDFSYTETIDTPR